MTCPDARAALLEAEPADLRSETETELAAHLRGCTACRTAAEAILETERAAAAWIAARPPRPAPHRRRAWRWVAPLAAAAGIGALVLVTRPHGGPRAVPRAPAPPAVSGPGGVAARAPAGRNVAVFTTPDPDIVVIWLY